MQLWKAAIRDELKQLEKMGTWKILQHSERDSLYSSISRNFPTHIVLKIKRDEKGHPTVFKARLVAGGNLQVLGKDCDTVYGPVVDYSATLFLLAVAVQFGWFKRHVDVKSALLNSYIDRETFVHHPYNVPSEMKSRNMYRLYRALYGQRQDPLQWFQTLRSGLLKDLGCSQLNSNGSILLHRSGLHDSEN